ncbi:FtsX-like permease family protein [Enterococcus faecalis]|uniref:FtsX-like permease family protein n=1 Tax=Enterococcus faecalis TaxID=1351 RepID=UPI003CEAFB0D
MFFKMSFMGMKGKQKDYIILFSGLIISTSIFYMFQYLANNSSLTESVNRSSSFSLIFQIGTILLGVITFVYLIYANSFLKNLKRKAYAMYMMLGAKKSKICMLIFTETFGIGIITTSIGIIAGMGFTKLVNRLLMHTLNIQLDDKNIQSSSAIISTLLFFGACFLIIAIMNANVLSKENLISLLKKEDTPEHTQYKNWIIILQSIGGLVLLGISYFFMANVEELKMKAIIGAMVTIVFGAYLTINSLVVLFLRVLRKNDKIHFHKLNSIFIAQLMYRVRDYTQILSIVSILFALALGALTAGFGFKNEVYNLADKTLYYDLVINDSEKKSSKQLSHLSIKEENSYSIKEDSKTIYFIAEQFNDQPLVANSQIDRKGKVKQHSFSAKDLANNPEAIKSLKTLLTSNQKEKTMQLVSKEFFNSLAENNQTLVLIKTTSFKENREKIKSIIQYMTANDLDKGMKFQSNQKYFRYESYNDIMVGFEYMGFFLGIAFLAMLISCLMFKILSGLNIDKSRYLILVKIGASEKSIKGVVLRELLVVFLIPAILGTIHVLFGLQIFKLLLMNPYEAIIFPFALFIIAYLVYFLITYKIYVKSLFTNFM